MVDWNTDYLGLLGFDERALLYGRSGLPDTVIAEVIRGLKRSTNFALHPDRLSDASEVFRTRATHLLAKLNAFTDFARTKEGWLEYKRKRRGVLQANGTITPVEVQYAQRIDDLQTTIGKINEEVREKRREIERLQKEGGASAPELAAIKEKVKGLERERDNYRAETIRVGESYRRELEEARTLKERVGGLEAAIRDKDSGLEAASELIRRSAKESAEAGELSSRLERELAAYSELLDGKHGDIDVGELLEEVYSLRREKEKLSNENYSVLIRNIREGNSAEARRILTERFSAYDITRERELLDLYDTAKSSIEINPQGALENFRRLNGLDERHIASRFGAAEAASRLGNFEITIENLDRAIKINGESARAHYLLAIAQLNASDGATEKAEYIKWLCWKAESIDQSYTNKTKPIREATNYQAEMVWAARRGNIDETRRILKEHFGQETGYDSKRINEIIGKYLFSISKFDSDRDEAERGFRETLELDEKHVAARLGLFKLAFDRGDHQRARTEAEEAVKIDDNSAEAHYSLALLVLRTEGLKEADFAAWECYRAEQIDPNYREKTKKIRRELGKELA